MIARLNVTGKTIGQKAVQDSWLHALRPRLQRGAPKSPAICRMSVRGGTLGLVPAILVRAWLSPRKEVAH
jgi:hypothetical protein